MRSGRRLRLLVATLNLGLLLALAAQAWALAWRGACPPLRELDPDDFAPPAAPPSSTREVEAIAAALDRPLPPPEPPAEPAPPPPPAAPPPDLLLVAIVSPDDAARCLAIVRGPDGQQRVLGVGDVLEAAGERWEVVGLAVARDAAGQRGRLTLACLAGAERTQVYEAHFGAG